MRPAVEVNLRKGARGAERQQTGEVRSEERLITPGVARFLEAKCLAKDSSRLILAVYARQESSLPFDVDCWHCKPELFKGATVAELL